MISVTVKSESPQNTITAFGGIHFFKRSVVELPDRFGPDVAAHPFLMLAADPAISAAAGHQFPPANNGDVAGSSQPAGAAPGNTAETGDDEEQPARTRKNSDTRSKKGA